MGVGLVRHMFNSRIPLAMDNPRIVVFSRITEFVVRADCIVAAPEGEFTHV